MWSAFTGARLINGLTFRSLTHAIALHSAHCTVRCIIITALHGAQILLQSADDVTHLMMNVGVSKVT